MLVLEIAYNGEHYHGWQVQPNLPTVQGVLCNCLERLLLQPVMISGCSRTDAGVHARQFVATLECEKKIGIPLDRFLKAANHLLPDDIVIKSVKEAPEGISSCTITSSMFSCLGLATFSIRMALRSSGSILKSPVFRHAGSRTSSSFTSH